MTNHERNVAIVRTAFTAIFGLTLFSILIGLVHVLHCFKWIR